MRTVSQNMHNNKNIFKKQLNLAKRELDDFQETLNEYNTRILQIQMKIRRLRGRLGRLPPPFVEGAGLESLRLRLKLQDHSDNLERLQTLREEHQNQMRNFQQRYNIIKRKYNL